MTRLDLALAITLAALTFVAGFIVRPAVGVDDPMNVSTHHRVDREDRLAAQLVKERKVARKRLKGKEMELRGLRRTLRNNTDAHVALRLAGVVYGQDPEHIRRCWLSEGYRGSERYQRRIVRNNREGSGAAGPAPGTWAGTPFAGFDIYNVTAQAFATAWMWSQGRRREWAGRGC